MKIKYTKFVPRQTCPLPPPLDTELSGINIIFFFRITKKVANYLGEVLDDQRDKLHENLLANGGELGYRQNKSVILTHLCFECIYLFRNIIFPTFLCKFISMENMFFAILVYHLFSTFLVYQGSINYPPLCQVGTIGPIVLLVQFLLKFQGKT